MQAIGTNIKYSVDPKTNQLTILVDLLAPTMNSNSGKTEIIASSRGNAPIEGTKFFMGLNIYRYKEKSK